MAHPLPPPCDVLLFLQVVDYFVFVESPYTFTGKPKQLVFKENACSMFAPYLSKIVYGTYKGMWVRGGCWVGGEGYSGRGGAGWLAPALLCLLWQPTP